MSSKDLAGHLFRLRNIGLLFLSKAGGVLVGIVFLPLFNRLLGSESFGVVAVILSLQAFLVMLDLGMSTLVGRDVAAHDNNTVLNPTRIWLNAEELLTVFYVVIGAASVGWFFVFGTNHLSLFSVLSAVLLFWSLVLQNTVQAVLLSTASYMSSALLQIIGVLVRAALTALALMYLSPTIEMFLGVQAIVSILHLLACRVRCKQVVRDRGWSLARTFELENYRKLLNRSLPLVLFGIAGAAVMQLDKPLLSYFMTAADVAPYYLAGAFCMTPIIVLAGPLAQYFQPLIVGGVARRDHKYTHRMVGLFSASLIIMTVFPTLFLWLLRGPIIEFWLRDQKLLDIVVGYSAVLLPGVAIGAMGYIPYSLLVSKQDFRFQAGASAVLTFVTLVLVGIFAEAKNVFAICWVYTAYHVASSIMSFARALYLDGISVYARQAMLYCLAGASLLLAVCGIRLLN
ncbi:lipopolysaccharide biosynthesis protein [Allopusillimonas ginsengisoli]|uniref:lipopolysaccharide biosynthesis protein n=1 Tax=Allopusillimonas ginsengisoli TaxID=453575 RepID=UPI0039C3FB93